MVRPPARQATGCSPEKHDLHWVLLREREMTARSVSLRDANQQLAKYVKAVEAGESFIITRRGRPVARLLPVEPGCGA
jgi:prevent-host-death family protein